MHHQQQITPNFGRKTREITLKIVPHSEMPRSVKHTVNSRSSVSCVFPLKCNHNVQSSPAATPTISQTCLRSGQVLLVCNLPDTSVREKHKCLFFTQLQMLFHQLRQKDFSLNLEKKKNAPQLIADLSWTDLSFARSLSASLKKGLYFCNTSTLHFALYFYFFLLWTKPVNCSLCPN